MSLTANLSVRRKQDTSRKGKLPSTYHHFSPTPALPPVASEIQGHRNQSSLATENWDDFTAEEGGNQLRSRISSHHVGWGGSSSGAVDRGSKEYNDVKMHPSIRRLGRVIFPDQRWIIIWDSVILVLLIYVAFVVPYTVGVSGGWRLFISVPWMVYNTMINSAFFVDTLLYFFRAYRDQNGRLVFNLRRIRQR